MKKMIAHTEEEILEKFSSIFKMGRGNLDKPEIRVGKNTEELVRVTLQKMYEAPKLNLAKLLAIADFFGTKNISDPETFGHGGCETCDFGSCYGFTLDIEPEGVEDAE